MFAANNSLSAVLQPDLCGTNLTACCFALHANNGLSCSSALVSWSATQSVNVLEGQSINTSKNQHVGCSELLFVCGHKVIKRVLSMGFQLYSRSHKEY